MSADAPTDEKESTHLMIVKFSSENVAPPAYFSSLKDATDAGQALIEKDPDVECDVYQIRTRLKGKIVVESQHYNSGKIEK